MGAACCAGARVVVVAHPSPLGGGLGDGVSDFLVFDMVYQVLKRWPSRVCRRQVTAGQERRHRMGTKANKED